MARRRCCGIVDMEPCQRKFCPVPDCGAPKVVLGLEELEALRLKDLEGKDQAECAAQMGLSRPTFQRILYGVRAKLAQALVEGREICIRGGNYKMKDRMFVCLECGKQWEVEPCSEGGRHGYEIPCPDCGSMQKARVETDGSRTACGGGHGHGHGHGCCCGH